MFGVGSWEILFIGLVVLMIYGPEKLPEIAKKAATFFRHIKKIGDEVSITIKKEFDEIDAKNQVKKMRDEAQRLTRELESVETKISQTLSTDSKDKKSEASESHDT